MYPGGWPTIAGEQNYLFNGSLHRRFGYMFQRTLYMLETKIALLEEELLEADKREENTKDKGPKSKACSRTSPGHSKDCIHELGNQREPEAVLEETIGQLKRYGSYASILTVLSLKLIRAATLLLFDKDLRALPRISRSEHHSWWDALRGGNTGEPILDKDQRLFLSKREDFISTRIERSNYPLDWLIYGRLGPSLAVRPIFFDRHYTQS